MTTNSALTVALQRHVLVLENDLRDRVALIPEVGERWRSEHKEALARGRTASTWQAWRDDRVTQAAVAWVLTTVFVRFCEDNALIDPVWIAGPESRRQEALDAQRAFFRAHPEATDREWLEDAIAHLRSLPATAALVDTHSALFLVSPSGDAATALLALWRQRDDEGKLIFDLRDPELSTRFLGNLYQDLSKHARDMYALLQTPVFVEEFILDQTMEPALKERPLEGFRLIDPACGSGHFLLGAFARLRDRWDRAAPGLDTQARVELALDAIHGVDINAFAVAITRFRLVIAAMQACGLRRLMDAPAFRFHVAVGDSLLHGTEQLSLGMGFDTETDARLSGFVYTTEDLQQLRQILQAGSFDVVVGNPPYLTVKDKQLNAAYRARYKACKGAYALTVPFMERFYDLAKPAAGDAPVGWVGQITSNSFMKREFGSKLIEEFLVRKDVRLVADSEGAWIPGHNMDGTPTVILIGTGGPIVSSTVRVVLSKGKRETRRVGNEGDGPYWSAIAVHTGDPGFDNDWVTILDVPRERLSKHPWSLSGGAAPAIGAAIDLAGVLRVADLVEAVGRTTHTGADDCFYRKRAAFATTGLLDEVIPVVLGEDVRDFSIEARTWTLFPYDNSGRDRQPGPRFFHAVWPLRTIMSARVDYQQTLAERGLRWFDHSMFFPARFATPLSIAYAAVASHNQVAMDRGGKVFKQSAPVIKLPVGASEDAHLALLGILASSTACFWLKERSQPKGGSAEHLWSRTYDFSSTTLQAFPVPDALPLDRARLLDTLAQQSELCSPAGICAATVPSRSALDNACAENERIRSEMIAVQEELDWEVYARYGLTADRPKPMDATPRLHLGERAFEIALARRIAAGEEADAWFTLHGSRPITELPAEWPSEYSELVQRRLDLIAADPKIQLLEKPEYKRRWASEPWESRETIALRDWVLDRVEHRQYWFDKRGGPIPRSVGQLADEINHDPDIVTVLALWERRPDIPLAQSLLRLLMNEAVPYLAALRYTQSGLRKREAWEQTWALQRREDMGDAVGVVPVPPGYSYADFRNTIYWQSRGKLDVPKERFILYPGAGRDTDPTPLVGWAGWDHAQQALALNTIIEQREAEGWNDERLVPLTAGLAELQPWVDQWHSGIDASTGVDLAVFCRQLLAQRAAQVGRTIAQLREWRPESDAHARRPPTQGETA